MLTNMLAIALAAWSALGAVFAVPTIEIADSSTSTNADFRAYERIWAAWTYVETGECAIWVSSGWETQPTEAVQRTITHEVGHCLWLTHHNGEGVMGHGDGFDLTPADRMELWRVHPLSFRAYVPGVAR